MTIANTVTASSRPASENAPRDSTGFCTKVAAASAAASPRSPVGADLGVVVEERVGGQVVEVDAERADVRRAGEVSLGRDAHVDDRVLARRQVHDLGVEPEPDLGLGVVTGEATVDHRVAGVLGDHAERRPLARGDRHRVDAHLHAARGRDEQVDVDDRGLVRRGQLADLHGDATRAGRQPGRRGDA